MEEKSLLMRRLAATIFAFLIISAPALAIDEWWNSTWHYRFNVTVNTSSTAKDDWPIELYVNFTELFHQLGCYDCSFDLNSTRVVEYNKSTGNVLWEVPSQFDIDWDAEFDPLNNAVGTVSWILNGSNPAYAERYFYIYFDQVNNTFPPGTSPKEKGNYPTELQFSQTGDEFSVTNSNMSILVDTYRGEGTAGIYNITLSDGFVVAASQETQRTIEYSELYNSTSGELLGFNLSNNYTLLSHGPVRLVVEMQGKEVYWNTANPTNETFLIKRYIFYAKQDWIKIENIVKSIADHSFNRSSKVSKVGVSEYPASFANVSGWPGFTISGDVGSGYVAYTTDEQAVGEFKISVSGIDENMLRDAKGRVGESDKGVGVELDETSIDPGAKIKFVTLYHFFRAVGGSLAPFNSLVGRIQNPEEKMAGAPEGWKVHVDAKVSIRGIEEIWFNRGEEINITGNVTLHTHQIYDHLDLLLNNGTSDPSDDYMLSMYDDGTHNDEQAGDHVWTVNYTFSRDNITGEWNFTVRVWSFDGFLVNQSTKVVNLTDVYFVEITNVSNVIAEGYPTVINDSSVFPNISVWNYRHDVGIAGINLGDITCMVNETEVQNKSEIGGGLYSINFTSNSSLGIWNLSCSVGGYSAWNNTGSNFTIFRTEPKSTLSNVLQSPIYYRIYNVTSSQGNFTNFTVELRNVGQGTAFNLSISFEIPAEWINDNPSASPCAGRNLSAGDSCIFPFNVTIPPGVRGGNYSVNVTLNWSNLENYLRGEYTSVNSSQNSSKINVISNPIMEISKASINLGDIHHNTSKTFYGNFSVNNSGNDWLGNVTFTRLSGNASASWFSFSPNFFPVDKGNYSKIDLTVSIPKGYQNGSYNATFEVNATETYSYCISGESPIAVCNGTIEFWVHVPENKSWVVYDTNLQTGGKLSGSNVIAPAGSSGNFGILNVSNEANFNLTFYTEDFGDNGTVNLSTSGFFDVNITEMKTIVLNYTIPINMVGTLNVSVRINATDADAKSWNSGTNVTYVNFTMILKDVTPPKILDVNVSPSFVDAYYENVTISAVVTDEINVSEVWAVIKWGSGQTDRSLQYVGNSTWSINYSTAPTGIANTTVFNVTIYAKDNSTNTNDTSAYWPYLGFYSVEIIDEYSLENYPSEMISSNITQTGHDKFNLTVRLKNLDDGAMRNVTVNLSTSNQSIIVQPNSSIYSKLIEGDEIVFTANVTVLEKTVPGLYYINVSVNWTNPDYTVAGMTANSTSINVARNPVVNVTMDGVDISFLNLTVMHGMQNSTVAWINSTGNYPLEGVEINCTGGICLNPNFTITFNSQPSLWMGDIAEGNASEVRVNVSVARHYHWGSYVGSFTVNASASQQFCVEESRCKKAVELNVTVPPDREWWINTSDWINGTVDVDTDCYELVSALGTPNGTVCTVYFSNTGNAILNVTLSPQHSPYYSSSLSNTNLTLIPNVTSSLIIFYNNTSAAGTYHDQYTVTAIDGESRENATPLNRLINVTVIVHVEPVMRTEYVSPQIVQQGDDVTINVSLEDKSGIEVRWVNISIRNPAGKMESCNISYMCTPANPCIQGNFTSLYISNPENNSGNYRNVTYWVATYRNPMRGNYTIVDVAYVDAAFSNHTGDTPEINRSFTVKARLIPRISTEKSTYTQGDYVAFNANIQDLISEPLNGANVTINVYKPVPGGGYELRTTISCATVNGNCSTYFQLLSGDPNGIWQWEANVSFNDSKALNLSVTNYTSGSFTVKGAEAVVADIFYVTSPVNLGENGEVRIFVRDEKEDRYLSASDVNVTLDIYYPNGTRRNLENGTKASTCAGQPCFIYEFALDCGDPLGVYTVIATAKNETTLIYVTDSDAFLADYAVKIGGDSVAYRNFTLNLSALVYSGYCDLDPDRIEIKVEYVETDPPATWIKNPMNRLSRGFYAYQQDIPASQPLGWYRATVNATKDGVNRTDKMSFRINESKPIGAYGLSVDVMTPQVPPGGNVCFNITVTNEGHKEVETKITYWIEGYENQYNSSKSKKLNVSESFTIEDCFFSLNIPQRAYKLYARAEGPEFQTATAWDTFEIWSPTVPTRTPGAGAGAGGAAGGIAAAPSPPALGMEITAPAEINVVRGWITSVTMSVKNTGDTDLTDLRLSIEGIPGSWWNATPVGESSSLSPGDSLDFSVTFTIPHDAPVRIYQLRIVAKSSEIRSEKSASLHVYGSWDEMVPDVMQRLEKSYESLKKDVEDAQGRGVNVTDIVPLLEEIRSLLDHARQSYLNGEYRNATIALDRARMLLDRANALLGARVGAPPLIIPEVPALIVTGIIAALGAIAVIAFIWTERVSRALSRAIRAAMFRPPERRVERIVERVIVKKKEAPPEKAAPPPRPKPVTYEKLERARRKTEELLQSLKEQYERGVISKERYEEMLRMIKKK